MCAVAVGPVEDVRQRRFQEPGEREPLLRQLCRISAGGVQRRVIAVDGACRGVALGVQERGQVGPAGFQDIVPVVRGRRLLVFHGVLPFFLSRP
ncbi:hypothetical protein DDE05_51375 [Streptomyces cavourensis]|nr:hypothetical protein DDE05_51375 [Streptomyces cavourensis]